MIIKNAINPLIFYPAPLDLPPEEFRDVTSKIVPGVKDYYLISNYGRLWSKYSNKFILPAIDSKGYTFAVLATENGPKNCRIHRLVLMTFDYFKGCENTIINHKDGIKTNAFIWNLEWSTYSDNLKHAIRNNLMRVGQKGSLSDEQVHIICQMLENGESCKNIANKLSISVDIIYSINCKRSYTNISDQYNLSQKKQKITDGEVRKICQYFSMIPRNKKLKNDYCSEALKYANMDITLSNLAIAERILYRQSFKNISSEYNW